MVKIESHGPMSGVPPFDRLAGRAGSAPPVGAAKSCSEADGPATRGSEPDGARNFAARAARVDQPWEAGGRNWPELTIYAYRGGLHQLRFFSRAPGLAERETVATGSYEFGLNVYPDLAFLFFRARGEDQWRHVPVSWWTLPEAGQIPPGAETPAEMELVMIDCESGLVLATGRAPLGSLIARQLNSCLNQQANSPHAFMRTGQVLEAALLGVPKGAKLVPTLVETN